MVTQVPSPFIGSSDKSGEAAATRETFKIIDGSRPLFETGHAFFKCDRNYWLIIETGVYRYLKKNTVQNFLNV